MTSYLRSWLWTSTVDPEPSNTSALEVPTLTTTSPQASDDEGGSDTETEINVNIQEDDEDDDVAPAFPSMNSAQRVQSSTPKVSLQTKGPAEPGLRVLSDSALMPPPPLPNLSARVPGVRAPAASSPSSSSTLSPTSLLVPSRASGPGSSLAVPPSTTKAAPLNKPAKKGQKVALAPGHSALDWAALKSSGADLRGVDSLHRITLSELKQHNKKDDAWSAFYGKVYNITPYIAFHPGGEKELMRVAGRDGTKLFATTHGWVNVDFMMDACLVGFLVGEPS